MSIAGSIEEWLELRRGAGVLILVTVALVAGCRTGSPGQDEQAVRVDVQSVAPAGGERHLEEASHAVRIDEWHRTRIERLRAEDGWLSLVGLHWLEPGDNTIGANAHHAVANERLPVADVGVIRLEDAGITMTPAPGVAIGGLPQDGRLLTDADGSPTILSIGTCRFHVIVRGDRFGVRIKDVRSPVRMAFVGVDRFPVDPAWRIEARFEAPATGARIAVPSVLGTTSDEEIAGRAHFEHAGVSCRMVLMPAGAPERFFVVFGDRTNGETTYGGGRFLEGVKSDDGAHVIIDFNRAYNPPCVFTPYATCPLPVADNRLPFAVPAGERMWGGRTDPADRRRSCAGR